ncbi:MAG: hypothetical protein LBU21_08275, partial [Treponema sp.]|nr:hypothetical protein [Treponema sp.]
AGGEAPREKTIFIPADRIVSAELRTETSWLKKLLFPHPPVLVIRYRKITGPEDGPEAELIVETEYKTESLLPHLGSARQ